MLDFQTDLEKQKHRFISLRETIDLIHGTRQDSTRSAAADWLISKLCDTEETMFVRLIRPSSGVYVSVEPGGEYRRVANMLLGISEGKFRTEGAQKRAADDCETYGFERGPLLQLLGIGRENPAGQHSDQITRLTEELNQAKAEAERHRQESASLRALLETAQAAPEQDRGPGWVRQFREQSLGFDALLSVIEAELLDITPGREPKKGYLQERLKDECQKHGIAVDDRKDQGIINLVHPDSKT